MKAFGAVKQLGGAIERTSSWDHLPAQQHWNQRSGRGTLVTPQCILEGFFAPVGAPKKTPHRLG
jgi:hypothetical protein